MPLVCHCEALHKTVEVACYVMRNGGNVTRSIQSALNPRTSLKYGIWYGVRYGIRVRYDYDLPLFRRSSHLDKAGLCPNV